MFLRHSIRPAALLLAPALLALGGCDKAKEPEPAPSAEAVAPSSEWVAENPTEPAVPVNLPNTPVEGTPAGVATEAAAPPAK